MTWEEQHPEEMRRYKRECYYRNRSRYLETLHRHRSERIATDIEFQTYISKHPVKICLACGDTKPITEYRIRLKAGHYRPIARCEACCQKHLGRSYPEEAARHRLNRRNPLLRAKYIVQDSRATDRKHGRKCDIDNTFVESLITKGCYYCGNTTGQMTIDRIDNNIGHIRTNINSACFRCNRIRSNMPYEAWMAIVPAIRGAFQNGLLGEWNISREKVCVSRL